jgi:hypothetical protein
MRPVRQRQRRRKRDALVKELQADQRTRIGRRTRSIERDLRNQLRRQGRTITIDIDLTCGQIAQAAVRCEAFRASLNQGHPVDDEQHSRLINILQRGLSKLGLRPTLFDASERERQPRGWVSQARWEAAQTATEGATATHNGPPDDRRRRITAE